MKKFLKILVLTIILLIVSIPVFASENIRVQLNGEYINFIDESGNEVEPEIINNRTMVPMRKIFEVFGANVEWIPETRSIKSKVNELEIFLQINNNIATIKDKNGEEKTIILDSSPIIINGRTLVPVRFIAESLNKKVNWNSQERIVIINDKEKCDTFSEYAMYMNELQKVVRKKMIEAKKSENLLGNSRDESQLYNFIARGGYNVLSKDDDGDLKWLTWMNSENIPCTKIDEIYFEDVFKIYLPIIQVNTYKSNEEQTSFFITKKGKIFSWPPYLHDGKSYVNSKVTVKDINGNELGIESTKNDQVFICFEDTGEVIVASNEQNVEAIRCNYYSGNIGNVGVWYPKEGVVLGIDFSEYNNWGIKTNINNSNIIYQGNINSNDIDAKDFVENYEEFSMEMENLKLVLDRTASRSMWDKWGNQKSIQQTYNFIARGGNENNKWISREYNRKLPCTKIEEEYAYDIFKACLPNIKVATYKNENEMCSYFVTPMGNVFCWPPYEYDGKSYVNSNTMVKDENEEEMTVKETTKKKQIVIHFTNGEQVIVSNEKNVYPTKYEENNESFDAIGVWYPKAGEILGIDFSEYTY